MLKYNYQSYKARSYKSGKTVALSSDRYAKGSRFLSQDEIDYGQRPTPLNINMIKDIDSILQALGEQACYSGNKVFGKSEGIWGSDGCFDSLEVRDSLNVQGSKDVAYSSYIRGGSESMFGCSYVLACKSSIRLQAGSHSARCFESYHATDSSDLFFTYNCHGVDNAMFSFNQRSKRYLIGNRLLPKDQYLELRKKLVEESRQYLNKHKDFPSIFQFSAPLAQPIRALPQIPEPAKDLKPIEEAFASTCHILLGKELGYVDEFALYLNEGNPEVKAAKTVFGGTIYPAKTFFFGQIPPSRLISYAEAEEAGTRQADITTQDSLEGAMKKLDPIALYICEWYEGDNHNIIQSPIAYNSSNIYRSNASFSKNVAYTVMSQTSESVFGSFRLAHSKSSMRCTHSHALMRCFEVSDSSSSSDCYFCHDVENCQECMFCFNVKAKRYAIGNVEYPKNEYMKIKKMVLAELANRLEKDKKLEFSIFNIGAKHG